MTDIASPQWLKNAPDLPDGLPETWRPLWRAAWSLHQQSCRPPLGIFDRTWTTVGAGYFKPCFGHWDFTFTMLDMSIYDPDFAADQLRLLARTIRESDGQLPGLVREFTDGDGGRTLVADYDYSPPPIWPRVAVTVFEKTGDTRMLRTAYEAATRGVGWWERHRRFPDTGLFWCRDSNGEGKWESGYDASPRWDGVKPGDQPFACVDLSGQMGWYYDALTVMAQTLDEPDASLWREQSSSLARQVRELLWHEDDGVFYDRDLHAGQWRRLKSAACFWPMVVGQATQAQADRLAEHLADPDEFFTDLPIPSVARNEPTFSLDCMRGPTWLSQTYLAICGLRRYGHHDLACTIGTRAMDAVARVHREHGTIFEFFHPLGGPVAELTRKGNPAGPLRDFQGHNPIHAIMLMVTQLLRSAV